MQANNAVYAAKRHDKIEIRMSTSSYLFSLAYLLWKQENIHSRSRREAPRSVTLP